MATNKYTARDVLGFIRRVTSLASLSFFSGWIAHTGLTMAVQDYYGRTAWLEKASESWVNMSPLWGAVLFGASVGLYQWSRWKIKNWENALEYMADHDDAALHLPKDWRIVSTTGQKSWDEYKQLSAKLYRLADWFDAADARGAFGKYSSGDTVQVDIRKAASILEEHGE